MKPRLKDLQMISRGVRLAMKHIIAVSDSSNYYLLTISEMGFNPCDFQSEGLVGAVW